MTSAWGLSECLSAAQLLVLAITAGVVGWYTKETRRLRIATEQATKEAERAREIEFHPWLNGSNLKLDPQPGHDVLIWLPIRNAGRTPALNVSFNAEFFMEGRRTDGSSYENIFIAPDDTAHFRISRFRLDDQSRTATVLVTVSYTTHLSGSGSIRQEFEYSRGGWRNKDGAYTIVLSTGETYPKQDLSDGGRRPMIP